MKKFISLIIGVFFAFTIGLGQTIQNIEMTDTDSAEYRLIDDFGNYDIICVFAYWTSCGWCKLTMPEIEKLITKYGSTSNINFIGLAYTDYDKPRLDDFIVDYNLDYLNFRMSNNPDLVNMLFTQLSVSRAYPTFFILNLSTDSISYFQGYDDYLVDTLSNLIDKNLKSINKPAVTFDVSLYKLSIYPVPASNSIILKNIPDNNTNTRIVLYSLKGEILFTQKLEFGCTDKELQIENIPSGEYILHIAGPVRKSFKITIIH